MIDANKNKPAADRQYSDPAADPKPGTLSMSKSMHDGVEVWCDCCSCEAEPYWIEAMQEREVKDPADK